MRQQFQAGCFTFKGGFGKTSLSLLNSGLFVCERWMTHRLKVYNREGFRKWQWHGSITTHTWFFGWLWLFPILIIWPLEYFASQGTRTATGRYFPNSPWQNGDFLGNASVSFRRRTPLLLGHHSTATDGSSITVNHTTRVGLAKTVVTVIGAWLLFCTWRRKWQPNSCFLIKSLRHKSPFMKRFRNEHDYDTVSLVIWPRFVSLTAS